MVDSPSRLLVGLMVNSPKGGYGICFCVFSSAIAHGVSSVRSSSGVMPSWFSGSQSTDIARKVDCVLRRHELRFESVGCFLSGKRKSSSGKKSATGKYSQTYFHARKRAASLQP
jgi:hypothetical protein